MSPSGPPPAFDPGSFRDPSSRVFRRDGKVFRALDATAVPEIETTMASPFFARAQRDGTLIATGPILPSSDLGLGEPWRGVVEHPAIDVWTYPTEWTFSMLRDAALLQLDLLTDALSDGFTCKDATPYNVQFVGGRPVFIDIGSFERYEAGDPWYGYLQFCQMYLYPLLLQAYRDLPFPPLLRSHIGGIEPGEASAMLGVTNVWRRGVPIHVALHARAQRRFADTTADVKRDLKKAGYSKKLIEANVGGLRRLIENLQWKRSESEWSSYKDRAHYSSADLAQKEAFVRGVAGLRHRKLAWDVGCNDGRFSRLIASHIDQVLAIDHDHLVVDLLYRALREEKVPNILPLVIDLADPPPAIGWRSRERSAFIDRTRPELVLFLAVIHHLAITANIPFSETLDLLADLGGEVVLELPTETDPMVQRLLRNKKAGVHDRYSVEAFETEAARRFTITRREPQSSGTRILYHLTPLG